MNSCNSGYGPQPRSVWADANLSANERQLFTYLLSFLGRESQVVWPSTALMMAQLGWGRDLLFRTMKSLEEKEYVRREKRKSRKWKNVNQYWMNPAKIWGRTDDGSDTKKYAERTMNNMGIYQIRESKDSRTTASSRTPLITGVTIDPHIYEILELFPSNCFSVMRRPKVGQEPSKTLVTFATEVQRIRLGTFLQAHQWDAEWLAANKGNYEDIVYADWEATIGMIRAAVSRFSELLRLGVLKYGRRSPLQFMVDRQNPKACRSAFLTFLSQRPRTPHEYMVEATAKNIDEDTKRRVHVWYDKLRPAARLPMSWDAAAWDRCWFAIARLQKWWDENNIAMNEMNEDGEWSYKMGKRWNFIHAALEFLSDGGFGPKVRPTLIEPKGRGWDQFVSHLLENHEIHVPRSLR